jgi:hypothetical protein
VVAPGAGLERLCCSDWSSKGGRPRQHHPHPPPACCAAALLRCCAAALLRCCAAALLRCCAAALLRCCAAALLPAAQALADADRAAIEKRIEGVIKDNQRFQRVVVSRDEALGMFQENKFKVRVRARGCRSACVGVWVCGCVGGLGVAVVL